MAERVDYQFSGLPAVVDPHNTPRDTGHQIDWENVSDDFLNDSGVKVIPALTAMGTLLGDGKVSPRVVTTNPAVGFLATAAVEGEDSAAASGYGLFVGGVYYENLLPDAVAEELPSAIKTELAANGAFWVFRTYSDDRA